MLSTLDIVFIVISAVLLVIVAIMVVKAGYQFRDKSRDVIEGMSEKDVLSIMEKEPIEVKPLKKDCYEWIYEKREWRGWGMMIMCIEIIFNPEKKVSSIQRTVTYDRNNKNN